MSLVVVTTPRPSRTDGIAGFISFGEKWRKEDPAVVLLLAMPAEPARVVRDEVDRLRMCTPFAYAELSLTVDGCGGVFGGAMDAALALGADALIHLPIDAEWERLNLRKLREMGDRIAGAPPAFVLGDYIPKLLRADGSEAEHRTKEAIGEFARHQIAHYGFGEVFHRIGLGQVRTEFWGMNRAFARQLPEVYPYDPVPFFAIYAQQSNCTVGKVDLGTFFEKVGGPEPWRIMWQLTRMNDQLAWAYLRDSLKPGSTIDREGRKNKIREGSEKVFEAMAAISGRLGMPY